MFHPWNKGRPKSAGGKKNNEPKMANDWFHSEISKMIDLSNVTKKIHEETLALNNVSPDK